MPGSMEASASAAKLGELLDQVTCWTKDDEAPKGELDAGDPFGDSGDSLAGTCVQPVPPQRRILEAKAPAKQLGASHRRVPQAEAAPAPALRFGT